MKNIIFGILLHALHKKLSFPLRISSVNATKSAGNCGFNHITEEIPNGKLHLWRSDVAAKMVNINQVLLMMIQ